MKKKLKGSYTVEASIITALVFFLTIIIIYFAFSAYDQVFVSFHAKKTLIWSKTQILAGFEIDEGRLEEKAKELERCLIINDGITYEGKINGDLLMIICSGKKGAIPVAARIYGLWKEEQGWSIGMETVIRRPEYALRIFRISDKEN